MPERSDTLPRRTIIAVAVLCALPGLLLMLGVPFAASDEPRGMAIHTILEWTAVCVALVSVHFSFVQFALRGDASTPIIGTALFCSGLMDAFHTLAADGLIYSTADNREFIPFTWAISRIVNAVLIVGGASLFLRRPSSNDLRTRHRGLRFVLGVSAIFGLLAYGIIHACAVAPKLPTVIFPGYPIPRPWDAIPLLIFLVGGGIVLPRFHRAHPSLFSHGLMVSILPQIAAQAHAAFGSTSLFDSHANVASFLKILAYQTPFYGMMLDYRRAYRAEASLRAAQEKLSIAREVQRGLLPRAAPQLPGFDISGSSTPADVMGGDWFDYIPLRDGRWGIVVADVSGHDVGASALMAQTRAYLRAAIRQSDQPGALLTATNQFVVNEVHDMRFVTIFFARLDPAKCVIHFSAAGHNAWVLEEGDAARELPPTGLAVGISDGAHIADGPETPLPRGSILVIVTDGILEAESLGGVPFSVERLLNTVRARRSSSAQEIVEAILDAVREHTGDADHSDDLTVVIVKSTL